LQLHPNYTLLLFLMKLDGLVVIITGGASGLGEAALRHLLQKGCKVAIADRNEERMNALQKEFPHILIFKCDVTKEEEVKAAVEGTVAKWGALHAALASAGIAPVD